MIGTNGSVTLSAGLPAAITTSPLTFADVGRDLTQSIRRETTGAFDTAPQLICKARFVPVALPSGGRSQRQQLQIVSLLPQESASAGVFDKLIVDLRISRLNLLNSNDTPLEQQVGFLFNYYLANKAAINRGEV